MLSRTRRIVCVGAVLFSALLKPTPVASTDKTAQSADAAADKRSFDDPNFFPIAVWLQSPSRAEEYRAAGINLYIGLWKGPTAEQLDELKKHGMRVICAQNEIGLQRKDDATIVGWMHGDEPDNAQSLGGGKGYGPPVSPTKIIEGYRRIKAADPSRPVLLNLGQGVAWDKWIGRGVRTNHPEDYAEYVKGCDIASFDIYPACHEHPDVTGKLWLVADGVTRLRKWSGDGRAVWNCIECTHIGNPKAKATPQQVKAEVWMSLIRGSRGLIYFAHEFKPKFIEAGLLADEKMLAEVANINRQITELAPVINSRTLPDGVAAKSSSKQTPVEAIAKRHGDATYIFAVAMRGESTSAEFQVAGVRGEAKAEVLGEDREISIRDGDFADTFQPWCVHLYRIR